MIAEEFIDAVEYLHRKSIENGWHDLRKNPEDLPEICKDYLVVTEYPTKTGNYATAYYNPIKRSNWIVHTDGITVPHEANTSINTCWDGVIAWRYIEPFEEVEE